MPLSAASSMYLVSFGNQESQRFSNIFSDLRVARIMESRFEIFVTIKDTVVALKDIPNQVTSEYFGDLQDALDKSVKIKLDGHEIPFIFKNAIHALQVLYFCEWKKHEMELTSGSLELKINHEEPKFENLWKIQEWNQYMNVCWSNLQRCYPTWKHQMCIGAIDP